MSYEAVSMTAIAELAGASIGALYDYFPDKSALTLALLAQYTEEADAFWGRLLEDAPSLSKDALADRFIEGAILFARERPAYVTLLGAPVAYIRSPAARQPLREVIAKALQTVTPGLKPEQTLLSAHIVVELIKGLLSVCKQLELGDREAVTLEFKKLMRVHLAQVAG